MGEQIQNQEPIITANPSRIMGEQIQCQRPIFGNSSATPPLTTTMGDDVQNQGPIFGIDSAEPADLFSRLRLNSFNSSSAATATACHHILHHPPCTAASGGGVSFGSNSMKRRSPSSCASPQAPSGGAAAAEPSAKKLFCDQEDLTLHGFSTISLPLSLGTLAANNKGSSKPCPVLRRCVSDPCNPPSAATNGGFPANPFHSPEHVCGGANNPVTPSSMRGSGLPPLPPSLRRSVSDLTPSPAKSFSRSSSSEETPNSMRLRRMKDRLREMRQWWDEVMREDEEADHECAVAEDDKVPSQDDFREDFEEAVSVEWAEKCVSITFRCPCGKGYEVLLSANNCYYKLL